MYLGDRWEYVFRGAQADPAALALRAYAEGREPGACRLALPARHVGVPQSVIGPQTPPPVAASVPTRSCAGLTMPACKALLIPLPAEPFPAVAGRARQHYLRIGLAISLLVHAGALAWRLARPP